MLQKGKDYITWEKSTRNIKPTHEKRGRLPGREKITPEVLAELGDYKSAEELSEALIKEETTLEMRFKTSLQITPTQKGYNHIRKSFNEGGTLGYRGDKSPNL
jgi:large subunit ribosomal protein L30